MTEQNDKMENRVDGMLRRWGAAEAMERAHAPAVPVAARELRPLGPPAGRYFLIGAAAGLLFAVCGVFVLKQFSLQFEFASHPQTQVAGAKHEDSTTIEVPVAVFLPDANHLSGETALAGRDSHGASPTTRDSVADLMTRTEDYRKKIAALEQLQDSREMQFQNIARTLKDAQDDNARLLAMVKEANSVQARYDVVEKRLAAAAGELARVRKMSDESQQAREKAQAELAAASAHRDALLLDIQRSLLGEEITLKSRQDAVKRCNLLDRCSDLRKTGATDASKNLMDKLEVALLRLSMLDASDTAAAASFGNLVREKDLVRQIDLTLASGGEGAKMRAWLVEVRCVLMGADRVA